MNYVKNLNLFGVDAQQIPCIPGEGAPTTKTEGAVGCLYMDTTDGNKVYKCVSAADGVYTWEKLLREVAYIYGLNNKYYIKVGEKTYNNFTELAEGAGVGFGKLYIYYAFYYRNEYSVNDLGAEIFDAGETTEQVQMFSNYWSDGTGYVNKWFLRGIGHCHIEKDHRLVNCDITISQNDNGEITVERTAIEDYTNEEIDEKIEANKKTQWKIVHNGDNVDVDREGEVSDMVKLAKEVMLGNTFDSCDITLECSNWYGEAPHPFICKLDSLYHITTAGENEVDYILYGTAGKYIAYFEINSSSDLEKWVSDIVPIYEEPGAITVTEELYKGRRHFVVKQGDTEIAKIEAMGKLTGDQLLSWLMTDYVNSTVSGDYSVSLGFANTSSGNGNVIGGIKNNATGRALGVFGENNKVTKCATGAIIGGKYADVNDDTVVLAIGNGTSESNRKNSLVVHKDGTIDGFRPKIFVVDPDGWPYCNGELIDNNEFFMAAYESFDKHIFIGEYAIGLNTHRVLLSSVNFTTDPTTHGDVIGLDLYGSDSIYTAHVETLVDVNDDGNVSASEIYSSYTQTNSEIWKFNNDFDVRKGAYKSTVDKLVEALENNFEHDTFIFTGADENAELCKCVLTSFKKDTFDGFDRWTVSGIFETTIYTIEFFKDSGNDAFKCAIRTKEL